jgi:hypothetical protein
MPRYASETSVPVERSRAEIEQTLIRYGANEFQTGWRGDQAMIAFRLGDLYIRFILPIPPRSEKRFTHKKDSRRNMFVKRSEIQAENAWNQELRQRWRCLLLTIKAKLEAVECGISTVEKEFLSFVVTSGGQTVGEFLEENGRLQVLIEGGTNLLLPKPSPTDLEAPVD